MRWWNGSYRGFAAMGLSWCSVQSFIRKMIQSCKRRMVMTTQHAYGWLPYSLLLLGTKSNTERRGFLSTLRSHSITEGSQDRNSKPAGTWRQRHQCRDRGGVLVTGLLLMACPSCFLIQPRPTCPVVALPTSIIKQENAYRPTWWRHFLN